MPNPNGRREHAHEDVVGTEVCRRRPRGRGTRTTGAWSCMTHLGQAGGPRRGVEEPQVGAARRARLRSGCPGDTAARVSSRTMRAPVLSRRCSSLARPAAWPDADDHASGLLDREEGHVDARRRRAASPRRDRRSATPASTSARCQRVGALVVLTPRRARAWLDVRELVRVLGRESRDCRRQRRHRAARYRRDR